MRVSEVVGKVGAEQRSLEKFHVNDIKLNIEVTTSPMGLEILCKVSFHKAESTNKCCVSDSLCLHVTAPNSPPLWCVLCSYM